MTRRKISSYTKNTFRASHLFSYFYRGNPLVILPHFLFLIVYWLLNIAPAAYGTQLFKHLGGVPTLWGVSPHCGECPHIVGTLLGQGIRDGVYFILFYIVNQTKNQYLKQSAESYIIKYSNIEKMLYPLYSRMSN